MLAGSLKIDTTRPRRGTRTSKKPDNNGARQAEQKASQAAIIPVEGEFNLDDSDLSDLTPLSSPTEQQIPLPETLAAEKSIVVDLTAIPSSPVDFYSTAGNPRSNSRVVSSAEHKVGDHVWVLLDREATVFDPKHAEDQVQSKEWIWWPAKVKDRTKRALKLHVFGSPAPSKEVVEARTPCDMNILSVFDGKFRYRYTAPRFVDPLSRTLDADKPSRKRAKLDRGPVEEQWRVGFEELKRDQRTSLVDDSDDDMPAVGSVSFGTYTSSLSSIPEKGGFPTSPIRGKRKRSTSMSSTRENSPDDWVPPAADDMLQIPGELVLAADEESKHSYWPARILDYIAPTKSSGLQKYLVEYLDTTKKEVPRHWFYTPDQPEFATCKLGKWESGWQEIINDEEGDKIETVVSRSPSPEPRDPPPEPMDFVVNLSTREELAYTKPVLTAILNSSYPPALQRHNMYLAGGLSRKQVVADAALRGAIAPQDVAQLGEHLTQWCLRDEKRLQHNQDPNFATKDDDHATHQPMAQEKDDLPAENGSPAEPTSPARSDSPSSVIDLPPTSSFTPSEHGQPTSEEEDVQAQKQVSSQSNRQQGCEAYEALSAIEKLDYCINVLLPEALLQILLWRGGHRRSIQLLPDEEEAALHEKGIALLREHDWVTDVVRLRQLKERTDKKQGESHSATGRPKRNVAAPGSYAEP